MILFLMRFEVSIRYLQWFDNGWQIDLHAQGIEPKLYLFSGFFVQLEELYPFLERQIRIHFGIFFMD